MKRNAREDPTEESHQQKDLKKYKSGNITTVSNGSRQGHCQIHPIYGKCRSVNTFQKINRIGEGTYGIVYRARDRLTGEIVALKRIRMEREKEGMPITSLREIKILTDFSKIRHPNIVMLKEIAVDDEVDGIFLVFEYMEHDLARLLDHMTTPFSLSEVKCILLQLLQAVSHLHKNWIIHRDLKLSNLLFNNKGQLRLADFGLARVFGRPLRPLTPKVVTLWYRAPELLFGEEKYDKSIDMWSVGCMMGELLLNQPLIPGSNELEQIKLICNLLGTPNEKIWSGFQSLSLASSITLPNQPYNNLAQKFPSLSSAGLDLLGSLLTYDPKKRITAEKALSHPFFGESPLPKAQNMMPTYPTDHDHLPNTQDATEANKRKPKTPPKKKSPDRKEKERWASVFGPSLK